MNKQIAVAVALACLSGASSVAFAQAKQQQDAGWYVGGSAGSSNTSFSQQDYSLANAGVTESKDGRETAYRFLVGYNFDRNWALEGAYTSLGEPKYKYAGTIGAVVGAGEARVKNDAWSLSVKGAIPVSPQFDIFGRLGWTYNRSELNASFTAAWAGTPAATSLSWSASKNRSDALVGIGVEFKPQKNWGIRAEYDNYGRFGNKLNTISDTGRTDTDMWSLGVVVRF